MTLQNDVAAQAMQADGIISLNKPLFVTCNWFEFVKYWFLSIISHVLLSEIERNAGMMHFRRWQARCSSKMSEKCSSVGFLPSRIDFANAKA